MTQQLFDDLTANPPPSTIDVPGIIRREKRRRTIVRAAGPAVAVLAVASAIAVLGPGRGPAPAPSVVAGTPPAASAAPPPVAGFRLVAGNQAAIAATAKTLGAALDAAVHRVVPGATWVAQDSARPVTPDGQPPQLLGDDGKPGADQMFWGATGITLDGRRGTLALSIISLNPCTGGKLAKCPSDHKSTEDLRRDMAEGLYVCQRAPVTCTASTGPDGRRQRVQTSTSLHGFVVQETTVELADGRALMLSVDNQTVFGGRSDKNTLAQRATPLSPAQVTAIADAIGDQILP
jgi:hypothetical protein